MVYDGGELGSTGLRTRIRDYSVARLEAKTVNVAANDNEVAYALAA
jgi:hypothetical protein